MPPSSPSSLDHADAKVVITDRELAN